MTETTGDMQAFLKARGETMKNLIDAVGGEGAIATLVRHELAPKAGGGTLYVSYLVDKHDRALGCLVEVLDPPRLEIRVAIYTAPRASYARQTDPLAEELPHSDLH